MLNRCDRSDSPVSSDTVATEFSEPVAAQHNRAKFRLDFGSLALKTGAKIQIAGAIGSQESNPRPAPPLHAAFTLSRVMLSPFSRPLVSPLALAQQAPVC
jgi:hypothetical protein